MTIPNPQSLAQDIQQAINEQPPIITANGYRVEFVAPLAAHVTDNGHTLAVTDYYCAHCVGNGDGEGDCSHKQAVIETWCQLVATVEAKRNGPQKPKHQPRRWDNQPTRAQVETWQS